jgi:hypothetical protein
LKALLNVLSAPKINLVGFVLDTFLVKFWCVKEYFLEKKSAYKITIILVRQNALLNFWCGD